MSDLLKQAIATHVLHEDAHSWLTDRGATITPVGDLTILLLPDGAQIQKDVLGEWIIHCRNEQGLLEYGYISVIQSSINVYQTKVFLRQYEKECPLCLTRVAHSYHQHERAVGR